MPPERVAIRGLDAELADPLGSFLEALFAAGDEARFHPHPLTREAAYEIARNRRRDVYLVALDGDEVVAYGMLRGWDAGYAAPSLGIAVHPTRRGHGLGRVMMEALHDAARQRGASRVRLTVDADHRSAIALYASLGYRLEPAPDARLVGWLELGPDGSSA